MRRPEYQNYHRVKKDAYFKNARLYARLTRVLPSWLIGRVFPVIGFLRGVRGVSVLDVGSGTGLYSHILRSRFQCDCRELEPHLENLYGAQHYVVRGDAFCMPRNQVFDVILLLDVLEHLSSTEVPELLRQLKSITRGNSRIFIKVPNASSPAGIESSFGDLTHVQHFNSVSLIALVAGLGYEVVRKGGVGANLTPGRLILRILSLPFDGLLWLHLKSRGCSGVLLSPAVMLEIRPCD